MINFKRRHSATTYAELDRAIHDISVVLMSAKGVQLVYSPNYLTIKDCGKIEGIFGQSDRPAALALYNDLVAARFG